MIATLEIDSDNVSRRADVVQRPLTPYPCKKATFTLVAVGLPRLQPGQTVRNLGERRFPTASQQLGASKLRSAFLNALMFLGAARYWLSQVACASDGVPSRCRAFRCMNFW
jgi:hypothetical protein